MRIGPAALDAGVSCLCHRFATGPSGPTLAQYGNGVYSAYQYDAMVRVASDSICSGSSQPNCPGGTMLYGYSTNWSGKYLTSMCDFVVYQCANLGYDDLGRLGSLYATSGNANSFSYSYDRWGNRLTQTVTQSSGPQPNSHVRFLNSAVA